MLKTLRLSDINEDSPRSRDELRPFACSQAALASGRQVGSQRRLYKARWCSTSAKPRTASHRDFQTGESYVAFTPDRQIQGPQVHR